MYCQRHIQNCWSLGAQVSLLKTHSSIQNFWKLGAQMCLHLRHSEKQKWRRMSVQFRLGSGGFCRISIAGGVPGCFLYRAHQKSTHTWVVCCSQSPLPYTKLLEVRCPSVLIEDQVHHGVATATFSQDPVLPTPYTKLLEARCPRVLHWRPIAAEYKTFGS